MVPNMSDELIQKLKTLQPGVAMVFGNAFKIPIIIKFDKPDPTPQSNSANVNMRWFK
jgi:DNA helicase HerA-like ATPase